MYWEGLLIVSKSHYEALGPDRRFILTEKVHDLLHPEIPKKFIGKSIMVFGGPGGDIEYEVEGQNFLAVSNSQVREFLTMSPREVAKRYSDDWDEYLRTGSSFVAKLYQIEQDEKIAERIAVPKKKRSKKRLLLLRSAGPLSENGEIPAAEDTDTAEKRTADGSDVPDAGTKPSVTERVRKAVTSFSKNGEPAASPPKARKKKPAAAGDGGSAAFFPAFRKRPPAASSSAESKDPSSSVPKTKKKRSPPSADTPAAADRGSGPSSGNRAPSKNYEIKKDTKKNKWCLKAIGASRAIGYYRTKAEATEKLNSLLAKNPNASATVRKADGTYQSHEAASVKKAPSRRPAGAPPAGKKRPGRK